MINKQICIISTEFPPGPGGIGKHAFDLTRALCSIGYELTVFTSQDYAGSNEIDNFNKQQNFFKLIRFYRTGTNTYYNRWNIINEWLKTHRPSKIIVTGRFSLWLGYFLKIKYGNKINVHAIIHGSEFSSTNKIFHYLTRKSIQSFQAIWAVSSFTKDLIIKHTAIKDIKVLPNGLWFDDWNDTENIIEKIELTGSPVLLTVGQVTQRKGQHRVIKYLPEIKQIYAGVQYHMVGIPTNKDQLLSFAKELKVENHITFHGRIPSTFLLESFYNSSDVFIMLSENQPDGNSEGFGIAILEANYFGKPAIGSKGCGIEDAIDDGNNGRLVDGNDPSEIIEALNDILENYHDYTLRAKKWAALHDWKQLIHQFENS